MPYRSRLCLLPILGMLVCALTGCGGAGPPEFRADRLAMVESELVPDHQQQIAATLTDVFGTPDEPKVSETSELDLALIEAAAGPVRSTQPGEALGLYRQHCAHCHGITGDGLGPTAALLDPYPRDFRAGKFKFKSTYLKYPPADADLRRTLIHGIPGTSMPSFKLLEDEQIDALVEYVKYLTQRGELERELIFLVADELDFDPDTGTTDDPFDPADDEDDADLLAEAMEIVEENWLDAEDQVVEPDPSMLPPKDRTSEQIAASVAAGRDLFYGTKANCVKCHGNTAIGDGQQDDYDDWTKRIVKFGESTDALAKRVEEAEAKLESGESIDADGQAELDRDRQRLAERQEILAQQLTPRNAIPRNMRGGVLRGGGRLIDIFWRIHQGVAGTPMPAHGSPRKGASGTLTDTEIWQLVDYVRALTRGDDLPPQQVGGPLAIGE